MTGHDLKVWLATNKMSRKQLAKKLGITYNTMNTYCNGTPPKWLKFALNGITATSELNEG